MPTPSRYCSGVSFAQPSKAAPSAQAPVNISTTRSLASTSISSRASRCLLRPTNMNQAAVGRASRSQSSRPTSTNSATLRTACGFVGMTEESVSLEELVAARETLIAKVVGEMPVADKNFLISFVRGQPDWASIGLPGAANLPAVKWRQVNLDKLTAQKRAAEVASLEKVLS